MPQINKHKIKTIILNFTFTKFKSISFNYLYFFFIIKEG